MKAIIHCLPPPATWQAEYFHRENPYLLPFVGKPLLEFYVDTCALCGVTDLLVLQENYDEAVESFLGDGSRWGVSIVHGTGHGKADSDEAVRHNAGFVQGDQVLYFEGFFLPLYDKRLTFSPEILPVDGSVRLLGASHTPPETPFVRAIPVDSLQAFHQVNMDLLENHAEALVMRGYGAEKGVFFGMNNIVGNAAALNVPFILGDNTQIEPNAKIGPLAILGDSCIVDKHTRISRTIIFDKTYLGADLELRDKIISGGTLIDPETGVQVEFRDNYFVAQVQTGRFKRALNRVWDLSLGLPLAAWTGLAYLVYKMIGIPETETATYRIRGDSFERGTFVRYYPIRGPKVTWFFKLSADKFKLLLLVLKGRMSLIGDTLWNPDDHEFMYERYKNYHAGAFTYTESLDHTDEDERLIDDLYYAHNRSPKTDLQLLLRFFVSRLLRGERF